MARILVPTANEGRVVRDDGKIVEDGRPGGGLDRIAEDERAQIRRRPRVRRLAVIVPGGHRRERDPR